MSIEAFREVMKDHAYKSWFNNSQKNILIHTASDLRSTEQIAQKTSFTINDDTIRGIAEYLSDSENISIADIEEIKHNLLQSISGRGRRGITITPTGELYFPRVSFDTIDTILSKGFKGLIAKSDGRKISDIMQKGHVFGIATNLLSQTMGNISKSQVPDKAKKILLDMLSQYEKALIQEDIDTTNIKDPTYKLYAKYKKSTRRYLVEMQVKEVNQSAGGSTALLTNQLRRYFNPANLPALQKELNKAPSGSLISTMLNTPGSPSYIDLITKSITNTLIGEKNNNIEYAIPQIEVNSQKITIDKTKVSSSIKKDLELIRNLKKRIGNTKPARATSGKFLSLANLQFLLNAGLAQRIKQNMGTGNAKNVLNYRTGRFANSAKVERITQSRDGMLSAFYSYMKYPYQTFEPGFRQGNPSSRDPKLLISKSIREIASAAVQNRMRAVRI